MVTVKDSEVSTRVFNKMIQDFKLVFIRGTTKVGDEKLIFLL
jgi:hypothetical protein